MFTECNAKIIYADAVTINNQSIQILKKLGMNQIGTKIGGFKKEEVILDLYNYSISKNETEE